MLLNAQNEVGALRASNSIDVSVKRTAYQRHLWMR